MSDARMRVGIVGGGVLGTVMAYRLARRGIDVRLFEAGPTLGGLASSMRFGSHTVDRFYHVITPADQRMIATAEELGLGDDLRFAATGVGFFADGDLHPLNGIADFLRFGPLGPLERARLAWFVAQCQLRGSVEKLDDVPLEQWLVRQSGRGVYRRIWEPLLASRFEGRFGELPATYLWSRTRRMSGARTGKGRGEQMGCIVGGHQRLIDAMVDAARADGAVLETSAPVESLLLADDGGIDGVVLRGGERERFDLTVLTLQPPVLNRLLPIQLTPLLEHAPERWLGVVCLLLKVRRSLTPYYSINICEPTPITTVVETSHVVGTDHTDGLRLVYVPRYCAPDAADQREPDEQIFERYTEAVARVAPGFDRSDVVEWVVNRARYVEPVHARGACRRLLPVWPDVPRLALASNAQIYPWLLNGESVMRMAEEVAEQAAARLGVKPARRLRAVPVAA